MLKRTSKRNPHPLVKFLVRSQRVSNSFKTFLAEDGWVVSGHYIAQHGWIIYGFQHSMDGLSVGTSRTWMSCQWTPAEQDWVVSGY